MGRKIELDRKSLEESYLKHRNLHLVARELSVSRAVVMREMDRMGLERKKPLTAKVDVGELKTLYAAFNNTRVVAKKLGLSRTVVIRLMKESGIELNAKNSPLSHKRDLTFLAASGLFPKEIAKEIGLKVSYVNELLKKFDIPCSRFHKGYVMTWNGYKLLKSPPGMERDSKGYIREHRLVVIKHTGKPIPQGMVVHHINENKLDNRIENLQLMTYFEHKRHHGLL